MFKINQELFPDHAFRTLVVWFGSVGCFERVFLSNARTGLEKLFSHKNERPGLVSFKWCFRGGSVVFPFQGVFRIFHFVINVLQFL